MASYNKVLLMGNLTRDPELRYTPSNTPIASFGLAVNRRWRNQNGEQQEEVTFVDCEAWARTAEVINQYFKKGSRIFVEGRLKLDQWQDKTSGDKRSKLKVVIEAFEFIDTAAGGGRGGQAAGGQAAQGGGDYPEDGAPPQRSAPPRRPSNPPPPTNMAEDDIPF